MSKDQVFLTLSLLKGQLDELHDSIEQDILSKISDKSNLKMKFSESAVIACNVTVVNVGKTAPKLVVQELTKLRSFVDSLEETIVYMRQNANVTGEE